ncbi:hypothetical protein ACKWTF_001156 [Chironomus riparius]
MWTLYVGIFIALVWILDYFLLDRRQFKLVRRLNHPLRLPLIGQAWLALGIKPSQTREFIDKLNKGYNQLFPNVLCIYMGNKLEVGLSNYKYVERILTSTKFIAKSSLYDFLGDVLGEGLLFSTNQKWFERRRIITPTFHFKILGQFFEVFQKHSENLCRELENLADGRTFDVTPHINMTVLKSLCETAMGCEINEKDYSYLNAVKELSYHVATNFLTPWHRIKLLYNLTPTKRAQDKCAKIIHDFTTKLIEERRKMLIKSTENQDLSELDNDEIGLKRKMCLLDVLLQSTSNGKPLSNDDIREEVNTFTFAGHDTTTIATCFTLYMISKHVDVQQKLNKEIEEVLGKDEVTFKSLSEFKYLDMVIKETLRLYPPVPIISRRLYDEDDFEDFVAPGNANYNLFLYSLLRNPANFEKPDEFNPDRFLENITPFGFIPFSAGQRNCIGQKFAMINIKTTIINILRNFEIFPGFIESKIEFHITLKSNGSFIALQKKIK